MSDRVTPESVKIGLSYTSIPDEPTLEYGTRQGAELAVVQLNADGGVHGMPIELISKNNRGDPDHGVAVIEELITQDMVDAVIGPMFSTVAVPMSQVAQRYRVPLVTTGATNPAVTSAGNYVFMAAFTDDFQGKVMAQFATHELGAETAAILNLRDDVYSEGLSRLFTDNFTAFGGDVVAHESYPRGATDFTSQLAVIAAADPDVVFIPGFVPESPLAVKQGKQAGIDAIFLGGDGWDNSELLRVGGDALEGSYFSTFFSANVPAAEASAEARRFIVSYINEYNEAPTGFAALGYDALRIVAEAMRRAGPDMSAEAIRAEIEATNNYNGATSLSGYNGNRHATKSAVIMTVGGGEVVYYLQVEP